MGYTEYEGEYDLGYREGYQNLEHGCCGQEEGFQVNCNVDVNEHYGCCGPEKIIVYHFF